MKSLKILSFSALLTIIFVFAFQFQSCKHEPVGLDKLDTVCFQRDIKSIFIANCFMSGCHSVESHKSELDSSYASIRRKVTPGNPWTSSFYTVVSNPNNPNFMPPSGHDALSKADRTLIEVWIEQGAQDTHCSSTTTPKP